jgi:hypothetical protein
MLLFTDRNVEERQRRHAAEVQVVLVFDSEKSIAMMRCPNQESAHLILAMIGSYESSCKKTRVFVWEYILEIIYIIGRY